jgi:hypothetical protein
MQRPWAGLRPIQVIMKKASGTSTLEWPPGTPALYKQLAQVNPEQRLMDRACSKGLTGCSCKTR